MPASRKKPRATKGINFGLLTDDKKKLQYYKSHLPARVSFITVGGKSVKPGDQVVMDIAGDDSGTSTSDDVCIAEVLDIRSPDHNSKEQFVLIRWYYSGSMLQKLHDPAKAIQYFSTFMFAPRELVSSDHMQVFPSDQLAQKISVRAFHETNAEQPTIGPNEWWCRYFWSIKQRCLLSYNKNNLPIAACGMGSHCIKGHYFAPHLEYQRCCTRGSCQIWYHIDCLQSAKRLVKLKSVPTDQRLRLMLHGTPGFEWIDDPNGDIKFFEEIKSCLRFIHSIVDCAQHGVVRGKKYGVVGNFFKIKRARTLLVEAHQGGWPSDEEIDEFVSWKPPVDTLYRDHDWRSPSKEFALISLTRSEPRQGNITPKNSRPSAIARTALDSDSLSHDNYASWVSTRDRANTRPRARQATC
ncbi:hypothetical protein RSOLAG1IB_01302 [Rhizoctonia solani AG-1 IB]|uniref:BAH domain-containing protein n=1 Tax=Thanatephorus cucumeris (strain AG1-IB / isolate 7/3/14) TaxID=1108050 RepID=A0A0B7FGF9_THACB|nr:hypothetical protein RSOLAG1IB_01302 [Rhizoctonia solani AG-1 IB]